MSRRGRKKCSPFVMLEKATLDGKEWKELTRSEMIAYIYIKKNYNGSNNGKIPLSYSSLRDILKSSSTISEALKGLIDKEWIRKTQHGGMFRYYCLYELTGEHDRIR